MLEALEGKTGVYLYALDKAACFRPREATHLTKLMFDKGDMITRLNAFKTVLFSQNMGDARLIGDFFVKLLGASTPEERRHIIEPFIERTLEKNNPTLSSAVRGKLAWLKAYYHGWRAEKVS